MCVCTVCVRVCVFECVCVCMCLRVSVCACVFACMCMAVATKCTKSNIYCMATIHSESHVSSLTDQKKQMSHSALVPMVQDHPQSGTHSEMQLSSPSGCLPRFHSLHCLRVSRIPSRLSSWCQGG